MTGIELDINDRRVREENVSPTTTLLQYLRGPMGLTGTKEGCAEGDCGACTVAIVDPDAPGGPRYRAVNSCLVLLPMVHNKKIYTVEGIADANQPHPVQKSLVDHLGSQCGYCTPGVVMSMFEACYRDDLDEAWKLDDQMCGNLCRCTGYRPIRDATEKIAALRPDDRFEEARRNAARAPTCARYESEEQRFCAPSTLAELFDIFDREPERHLVCGGTDLSLLVTKRFEKLPVVVSLEGIATLRGIERRSGWRIGATTLLADLEDAAKDGLEPVERMLRFFGARQIKNRGTVGGNLCTASPIGDLAPVLLSLGATVELGSRDGLRDVALSEFFLGYRKTAMAENEILVSVRVPEIDPSARAAAYKVSKRQELDISTVAAGFYVRLDGDAVVEARLGYGGMAAVPARATATEKALVGKRWTEETVRAAMSKLEEDFTPIDDHRGSAWYRRTVAANLLLGFFFETQASPRPRLAHRPTGTVSP